VNARDWPEGLDAPALTEGQVQVWLASLEVEPGILRTFEPWLSVDEQARVAQFAFEAHRNHYVAARGILRILLARYGDCHPASLRFSCTPHGKPFVVSNRAGMDLRFNLSHSGSLALYAVARDREVGADIEIIRARADLHKIAKRFFSPAEVTALRGLSPDEQLAGFYACWTRKEAYIKARGEGLSLALDQFDVSVKPGEPAALLRVQEDAEEPTRWTLFDVTPAEGYAAAVAVENPVEKLYRWRWDPDQVDRLRSIRSANCRYDG
jgi:4'-phosphopantetheinyl transferase